MKLSRLEEMMLSMAKNDDGHEVHVAWPKEKRAVASLERKGLVTVRRTKNRIGGMTEWWFREAKRSSRDPVRRRRAARSSRDSTRRYRVVAINERTGRKVHMTDGTLTHAEAITVLRKMPRRTTGAGRFVRCQLEETSGDASRDRSRVRRSRRR